MSLLTKAQFYSGKIKVYFKERAKMLTIYLKAISTAFRHTFGDLWGVLWRPRYTLQEIYERGTWGTSLGLLLVLLSLFWTGISC